MGLSVLLLSVRFYLDGYSAGLCRENQGMNLAVDRSLAARKILSLLNNRTYIYIYIPSLSRLRNGLRLIYYIILTLLRKHANVPQIVLFP